MSRICRIGTGNRQEERSDIFCHLSQHDTTRMHSSRMRTARPLTVSHGRGSANPPSWMQTPWMQTPLDADPPVNRMPHRFKNITLLQTSFAGGNKQAVVYYKYIWTLVQYWMSANYSSLINLPAEHYLRRPSFIHKTYMISQGLKTVFNHSIVRLQAISVSIFICFYVLFIKFALTNDLSALIILIFHKSGFVCCWCIK